MLFKHILLGFVALGAIAFIPATSEPAFAAKHITYEQAWAKCKKFLDDQKTPGTLTSNDRYYRGSACMKKFGHNI